MLHAEGLLLHVRAVLHQEKQAVREEEKEVPRDQNPRRKGCYVED